MSSEPFPAHPHIRSFTLRRGRMTESQRRAADELMPLYGIPYRAALLDLAMCFSQPLPVVVEIGFGMGETTAEIAAQHPEIGFVGVEVFRAGVGALLRRVNERHLNNVRVIHHDAVEVVRDMLAPGCLAGVHMFFPDPWPKKRHHKRRLLAQPFIGLLASRIRAGGYLHCATDWADYAGQMLAELAAEPTLENLHAGFAPTPTNPLLTRPATKFQARGERLGHAVFDLVFERKRV